MRSASRSRLGKSHCKTNLHLSCLVSVNIRNALGPIQTPLHSCAEPNLIKFDFGAMVDADGVLVLNVIRQTLQNKKVNNSPVSRIQHFCTDRPD